MGKLCARGKAAAKRKFRVYPSAYANAYAVKVCKGDVKDQTAKKGLLLVIVKARKRLRGKNVARHSGLKRWFNEKWVDVKTGKPCGRQKGEKRGYPACRPSKRVSSKTPKTAGEMTASEKARFKREKTGSKKISYQHRRKKKKK